jgi:hypothetical protein
MRYNCIPIIGAFLLFIGIANAIAIIPPVVYFVTLSISTFIANAIVALLIFGALRGISMRKYFGKGMYEIIGLGLSALSIGILAIVCMLLSIWLLPPIDFEGVLICGLAAAILFILINMLISLKQLSISDPDRKRSIIFSWVALAIFIGLATGASAQFSMQIHKLPIKTGGYDLENYNQNSQSPIQSVSDAISGVAKSPSMAKEAPASMPAAVGEESKSTTMPSVTASPQPKPTAPAETEIWFIPITSNRCIILADSFSQSFQPSFNCYYDDDEAGKKIRIFCPVSISHSTVQMRGNVEFVATGGCAGNVWTIITESGFENIQRDA